MFVSLAEQTADLGQRRPITYPMKEINKCGVKVICQ
jgi:hypothetical protein